MREPASVLVPQMNVNDDHAVIVAWQVPRGGHVDCGAVIATLETTKSTFDVHADRAGYVFYQHEEKSIVAVGSVLAWLADDQNASVEQLAAANAASIKGPGGSDPVNDARFTRKAQRRMRELGLTVDDFTPTGRIDVAEVERVASTRSTRTDGYLATRAERGATTDITHDPAGDLYESLDQSPSKVVEAARLSDVYRAVVPSLVTVPVSAARARERLAVLAESIGPVTLLERVICESALTLVDYPDLNGFFTRGRGWKYKDIAVGFAVNAGRSLRVPVVRNTARLSQLDVCRAVRDLTLRYFREELTMQDVSGGTFTVTDLSSVGVTYFVPVLNDRQSAILGLCAADSSGQQNLVLAFDHRMSDGMRAASFLNELRERLES